jgi:phosphomannomutase
MIIQSISGIRGTIGGTQEGNLTAHEILHRLTGLVAFYHKRCPSKDITLVLARDGRTSGEAIVHLCTGILNLYGINVINIGAVPTPTCAMAIPFHEADGGIVVTASHNPIEYNGLKLLNSKGEFLSHEDGNLIIDAMQSNIPYALADGVGKVMHDNEALERHIRAIANLEHIDVSAIRKQNFSVTIDPINSVGVQALEMLCDHFGVKYHMINSEPQGIFAHPPEPREEHLTDLMAHTQKNQSDLGISIDPDGDRLVIIDENGVMINEEYTQVLCADYVLSHNPGTIVTNLSSSQVCDDIAKKYGVECKRSAVGEKNVVEQMKEVNAVFGGEGSGGVIYPDLHYGRDALVAIALVLSYCARSEKTLSEIRSTYPTYAMYKDSINLNGFDTQELLASLATHYESDMIDTRDGLKIYLDNRSWVHIRPSNTEPIIRIYTEATTKDICKDVITEITQKVEMITSSVET